MDIGNEGTGIGGRRVFMDCDDEATWMRSDSKPYEPSAFDRKEERIYDGM